MSSDDKFQVFRVPMVVLAEVSAVDLRDAKRRAERIIQGAFQMSGSIISDQRGVVLRDSRNTASLTVVGVQELNEALRNHEFDIQIRDMGPTFRDRA